MSYLDREPVTMRDAKALIASLRLEIKRRPQCVIVKPDAVDTDTIETCPSFTPGTTGYTIEISGDNGWYVFHYCTLTESITYFKSTGGDAK